VSVGVAVCGQTLSRECFCWCFLKVDKDNVVNGQSLRSHQCQPHTTRYLIIVLATMIASSVDVFSHRVQTPYQHRIEEHLKMKHITNLQQRSPQDVVRRKPYLHFEIWILVMSQLVNSMDFPQAWISCRLVSFAFKRATEVAFLSVALPGIEVNLSLWGCTSRGSSEVARLEFKCFSEGGERVHFGEKHEDDAALTGRRRSEQFVSRMGRTLDELSSERENWYGNPPILVEWAGKMYISVCRGETGYHNWSEEYRRQLRHVWLKQKTAGAMDISMNMKRRYVSFLWKPLLNIFFAKGQTSSTKTSLLEQRGAETSGGLNNVEY
jgi:hypothetical protein